MLGERGPHIFTHIASGRGPLAAGSIVSTGDPQGMQVMSGTRDLSGRGAMGARIAVLILICLVLSSLAFQRNTKFSTELTFWSDAVVKSPEKSRTRYSYGHSLALAGFHEQALEQFQKALSLPIEANVDIVQMYYVSGLSHYYLQQYADAIEDWEKVLRFKPNDPEILNNLAMTYLKTGRSAQALVYAESAQKTATESFLPDVLLTLGQIHAAMGRFSIATRCIQEALRKADEMPGIYKSTAILYEELRLYEKAYHYASLYLQKVGATERQEAVRLRDRISEMLPESRQRAWSD